MSSNICILLLLLLVHHVTFPLNGVSVFYQLFATTKDLSFMANSEVWAQQHRKRLILSVLCQYTYAVFCCPLRNGQNYSSALNT